MKKTLRTILWCSALCGSIATLMASPPVIGMARSWGAFFINDASVPGSATLLDGTSVKTTDAASDLNLTGGERVTLSSNSAATIRRDSLLLTRGTVQISGNLGYQVEARNLRIAPSDSTTRIRVAVDQQDRVLVASASGAAEVHNAAGLLVARVFPGDAFTLSPSAAAEVDMTGVVQMHAGKFYMTDELTKVKMELLGKNLKSLAGKRAHVLGTESGDIVTVSSATLTGAGALGSAAAGAGVASKSFPTLAVAGGVVAVGGVVGGLAATGVIGSSPTVSR